MKRLDRLQHHQKNSEQKVPFNLKIHFGSIPLAGSNLYEVETGLHVHDHKDTLYQARVPENDSGTPVEKPPVDKSPQLKRLTPYSRRRSFPSLLAHRNGKPSD